MNNQDKISKQIKKVFASYFSSGYSGQLDKNIILKILKLYEDKKIGSNRISECLKKEDKIVINQGIIGRVLTKAKANGLVRTIPKKELAISTEQKKYDNLKLSTIYDLFDQISRTKVLSRNEFADVIVTFVQNIPYNILTTESCSDAYLNSKSIKDMIDQGIDCDGNIFGGLYTPTEFIKNFRGDCDTRTVFLYTILNRYGYDTHILNSDIYGHSIIGINLPSRGRYKTYLGKRYYTWETTNVNWKLGDLPPATSNMKLWWVAL